MKTLFRRISINYSRDNSISVLVALYDESRLIAMFATIPDSPVFCSNIFFKSTSNHPSLHESSSKAKLLVAPTFLIFFFLFES